MLKNRRHLRFQVAVLAVFLCVAVGGYAEQSKLDPSFQILYSPLAVGEAMVGASGTQTLTNKTLSTGCVFTGNVIADAYLDAAITRDTEANATMTAHAASQTSVHGLPASLLTGKYLTNNGSTMSWATVSGTGITTRQIVVIGGTATTTVTLGTALAGTNAQKIFLGINGVMQDYEAYVIDSTTKVTLDSTAAAGSRIDVTDFQ